MDSSPHRTKKSYTEHQEYKLKTNKRVKEIVLLNFRCTQLLLDQNECVHVSQIHATNLNELTKKTFYEIKRSRKYSSLYLHSDLR